MKFAWVDLRAVPQDRLESVVDAAIHARIQGVLSDDRGSWGAAPTVQGVTPRW
ncbi:hypothetical protein NKH77_49615 [Streptomyces sp. M19]